MGPAVLHNGDEAVSGKLTRADVQEILAILDKSAFDELNIETADFKLSLRRSGAAPAVAVPAIKSMAATPTHFVNARPPRPTPAGFVDLPAPMLGTYFYAPKPGDNPFVTVGSKVTAETIIGIIEVMKLMNTVAAGIAGEVTEIFAADGKPVEFGQPLLRVKLT